MKIVVPTFALLGLSTLNAIADPITIGLQSNVKGPNTTSSASLIEVGQFGFSLQHQ
ncbi:MAG: hypothetical protein ACI80L_000824 [Pseudohongiellaceae bacterium]|jgi:hypothetical protein